jgi:exodeoxyribonuclease VII small subunit
VADTQAPVDKLSYEEALAELEGLIKKLEQGSIDLADSIACYERGVALAARCAQLLEETERKVERLILGPGGTLAEKPLEEESPSTSN